MPPPPFCLALHPPLSSHPSLPFSSLISPPLSISRAGSLDELINCSSSFLEILTQVWHLNQPCCGSQAVDELLVDK